MRWKVKIFNIVRIVAAIDGKCGEQKQKKRLSSSNVDTTINDVFFFRAANFHLTTSGQCPLAKKVHGRFSIRPCWSGFQWHSWLPFI